ncbi:MAG: hypothetical protein A2268_12280 [Candidatus Raymondbacteria bacterium RifOxyA12_full_50_37]|uniref:Secretion system C-terminal sorting domain-containing protein n=1 Tax=Candidatus Raymondbacteria bacterium RIFOXYD12_FULL_49_13 TaxID=1817890 RepID=A0A1F7F8F7_UNCRA|nr:MAG: hypothetical protein A2350_20430 [Candidatus Raymondbacteria bacterium RifOxyB12_full_50_8]OGJ90252.1 MAG: hypothetical protein A2268_12280 [Candidatus Raymondbacteria bacterium RifOxyA12_full_50_37]OGJ91320.1 MAG: hypothetical protein A2248_03775 [Candidatus Raymondbacteria bacterium RIFOXYA2_FULL_49_16]OGJ97775.1 MAG: hypothetical protein A2453_13945 [Candidatus Raymondbacteria bacterium RIFOXYC2_FULL_50_21]OGK02913.1 MAG: hypothetical protein A2519_06175 [Candidatus Raymondbacteria b
MTYVKRNAKHLLCVAFYCFLLLVVCAAYSFDLKAPYELPDASSGVKVWADQFATLNAQAAQFAATHFVGCQKIEKSQSDLIRVFNNKFLVLHYIQAYGPSVMGNWTLNGWESDINAFNGFVEAHKATWNRESYFQHFDGITDSAHRVVLKDGTVFNFYLADLNHAGWRQYFKEQTIARCSAYAFNGTFFDNGRFPESGYYPSGWFNYPSGGFSAGDPILSIWWNTMALDYWTEIRTAYHAESLLVLPNIDRMMTGWVDDFYVNGTDGGMVENWFTGMNSTDWGLSAGRILKYITGADKILMAHAATPAINTIPKRHWCIANYFLLKNRYSYYVLCPGTAQPYWWAEYDIDLGYFLTPPPATLADLMVGRTGVYAREYQKGIVFVNPSITNASVFLDTPCRPLSFSGGGLVMNGQKPVDIQITLGAIDSGIITIPAQSGIIYVREHPLSIDKKKIKNKKAMIKAIPNPFNPTTTITVYDDAPQNKQCVLTIRDIRGNIVETIKDMDIIASGISATWDAKDRANGIYFVKADMDSRQYTTTLVLMK